MRDNQPVPRAQALDLIRKTLAVRDPQPVPAGRKPPLGPVRYLPPTPSAN